MNTAENIRRAIEEDIDPLPIAYNHLHLNTFPINELAKIVLKMYWQYAEEYLTDVEAVYNLLSQNPEVKALLDTPEGRSYLNRMVKHIYNRLYAWVWEGEPLVS